jgi:uncharacterized membrane protein YdjX (TVP38/TMEM64 family)
LSVLQARASSSSKEYRANPGHSGASGGPRWRAVAKLLAILVLAVGLPILVGTLGGGERLRALVEQSGSWAPLTYVAAKAAATIVAPFSGVPLKTASGALFGLTGGVFYSLFGDVIGGCVCFLAARYVGWRTVERFAADGRMSHVNRIVDHGLGGWRELLFLRVTFPAIYNLLSYAAGTTKLPFRQYLAVTAFGGIIHTSILVILGASVALGLEARLAAYAGIALLSLLALFGVRHLRAALARGA